MNADILDHLKSLHTRAIDARNGYDEALQDAEGQGLTGLFQEMISIHTTNATELAAELRHAGEVPDDSGSFMSTIHRTIMNVRSFFGGLGKSVVPGLIDGENRNVSMYRQALDLPDLPTGLQGLLQSQSSRLERQIVRMQSIQNSVRTQ